MSSIEGYVLGKFVRDGSARYLDFAEAAVTREPQRWEFLGYEATKVAELNAITAEEFGIGVDPVAKISTVAGAMPVDADGDGLFDPIEVFDHAYPALGAYTVKAMIYDGSTFKEIKQSDIEIDGFRYPTDKVENVSRRGERKFVPSLCTRMGVTAMICAGAERRRIVGRPQETG